LHEAVHIQGLNQGFGQADGRIIHILVAGWSFISSPRPISLAM
jgi:hypothetical protein